MRTLQYLRKYDPEALEELERSWAMLIAPGAAEPRRGRDANVKRLDDS